VEGSFRTGVFSPDGVAETRFERGLLCQRCGDFEEV